MAKTKKKKEGPKSKTMNLNIVIPVTVTCEKNTKFDLDDFESEIQDNEFDIQNIVEAAVHHQLDFEGGHDVGMISVEEITDVDRELQKLSRVLRTKLRIERQKLVKQFMPAKGAHLFSPRTDVCIWCGADLQEANKACRGKN